MNIPLYPHKLIYYEKNAILVQTIIAKNIDIYYLEYNIKAKARRMPFNVDKKIRTSKDLLRILIRNDGAIDMNAVDNCLNSIEW